jgi:hypothetical protein
MRDGTKRARIVTLVLPPSYELPEPGPLIGGRRRPLQHRSLNPLWVASSQIGNNLAAERVAEQGNTV